MKFARSFAAAAAALVLSVAGSAGANGRFPAANQLVVTPGNEQELTLRVTFGLLRSSNGGVTWDWICERAIGYGGLYDPPISVFEGGAILAGTIDGLAISRNGGCGWAFDATLGKKAIIDSTVRGDAPREGLVLATKNVGATDAGAALYTTEIFRTLDAGVTWTVVSSAFEPTFIAQTIEVAKSEPQRVYVSGSGDGQGLFYVSDDGGVTYEKRTVPLEKPAELNPFIAAVDPNNKDRVYVRTSGKSGRLLVTDDGGKSFRAVHSGAPLVGFALAPDGSRITIGSPEGVYVADRDALAFSRVSELAVQCLFRTAKTLYACGATGGSFALGASTDEGRTFKPVLELKDVRGPLACGAGSSTAQCEADWPALRATLRADGTTDGAVDGGSAGPGGKGLGIYSAEGGCSTLAGRDAGAGKLAAGVALAAVVIVLRRRRR